MMKPKLYQCTFVHCVQFYKVNPKLANARTGNRIPLFVEHKLLQLIVNSKCSPEQIQLAELEKERKQKKKVKKKK